MARIGICAGSYRSQSVNADDQICMNRYPENDESGDGTSAVVLYPTPGTRVFVALPESPVRGQYAGTYIDRAFAVAGSGFYELLPQTPTGYNLIAKLNGGVSDGSLVTMVANNANQLLICSQGQLYLFNFITNIFTAVNADLGPYSQVWFMDGYFIALIASSQKFQLSALEDGLTWNDIDVAQVLPFPDNIIGGVVDHEELWLMGKTQSLPYFDSGDANFPFSANKTGIIQQGLAAQYSIVQLDNTVLWIGQNQQGNGVAWRLNGYTPQRISTHAIEYAWQGYPTLADAEAYAYQDQGHSFWVIRFPSADKTWVYDVATNLWHERGKWEANKTAYTAHRSRCYMFWQGKHLVGDWKTGNIYEMSINIFDDAGDPLRWLRRAPHVSTEQQWMRHTEIQIYLESGLGPAVNGQPIGLKYLVLEDPSGQQWRLSITDAGMLNLTTTELEAPSTVFLTSPGKLWLLGVDEDLELPTVTQVPDFGQERSPYLQFLSTGRVSWRLRMETGENRLQTINLGTFPTHGPLLMLRYSDDGGHTWSNERQLDCGSVGEFKRRVIARRLGRSRNRTYEISGSDPIPYRIIDAYLKADPGFTPSERLPKELQKRA